MQINPSFSTYDFKLPNAAETPSTLPIRPSNINVGLVGIGQAIVKGYGSGIEQLTTYGCSPCLALGILYKTPDKNLALLAHLPPETNIKQLTQHIIEVLPDDPEARVTLAMSTELSLSSYVGDKQKKMMALLCTALVENYPNVLSKLTGSASSVKDRVTLSYDSDRMTIDLKTMTIDCKKSISQFFTPEDLNDMQRTLTLDSSKVRFFNDIDPPSCITQGAPIFFKQALALTMVAHNQN